MDHTSATCPPKKNPNKKGLQKIKKKIHKIFDHF